MAHNRAHYENRKEKSLNSDSTDNLSNIRSQIYKRISFRFPITKSLCFRSSVIVWLAVLGMDRITIYPVPSVNSHYSSFPLGTGGTGAWRGFHELVMARMPPCTKASPTADPDITKIIYIAAMSNPSLNAQGWLRMN